MVLAAAFFAVVMGGAPAGAGCIEDYGVAVNQWDDTTDGGTHGDVWDGGDLEASGECAASSGCAVCSESSDGSDSEGDESPGGCAVCSGSSDEPESEGDESDDEPSDEPSDEPESEGDESDEPQAEGDESDEPQASDEPSGGSGSPTSEDEAVASDNAGISQDTGTSVNGLLPNTGSSVAKLAGVALAFGLAGAAVLGAARRRRAVMA